MKNNTDWVLWSAKLSPFALKVDALLRQAGMPFKWHPEEAGFRQAWQSRLRVTALLKGRLEMTWPPPNDLRELPLVPYLLGPHGENLYDSSAVAQWLTDRDPTLGLLPPRDSAEGFAVRLVDEALDEIGLYLAHHNRWVNAAEDNTAGERLAAEMKPLLGPASLILRTKFPPRQTRRLPYLFSVASDHTDYSHLPVAARPPGRPGFPPTHELLDRAFLQLLTAVETTVSRRPYLFGSGMSLADASILGQLGMNRTDPGAWKIIHTHAPATAHWIDRHYLKNVDLPDASAPRLFDDLQPLLHWCCEYFVPLMQQNYRAYQHYKHCGETLFNEAAFNRNRSLYYGELAGMPFRSVAKTFQVLAWQELQSLWQRLPAQEKAKLDALLPPGHGMEELAGSTAIQVT